MANFSGYKTKAFSESQKFFVLDPNTGSPSFVLGSDLVDQITPNSNYVYSESTRTTAQATDYAIGSLVQTAGATSAGDNFAAVYLVVASGEGDFPMDNGNELLVIAGDELLREQLAQNDAGDGSDLVAHTGTNDTVTEALDKRTIYVGSVAELEASSGLTGSVFLQGYYGPDTAGGGELFVDDADTTTVDDGGSVFVTSDGKRVKRVNPNLTSLSEWGIRHDSSGAAGNGTDNTARLQALATYITGTSGVKVRGGDSGTVRFIAPTAGDVMNISDAMGVRFECSGTTLFDDRTYDDATNEASDFFVLQDVDGFYAEFDNLNTYTPIDYEKFAGLTAFEIKLRCKDIEVYLDQSGGLACLGPNRDPATSTEADKTSGIRGAVRCTGTNYPFNARFNGDDADLEIFANSCGRNYFVYGVKNHEIRIVAKDQIKSSSVTGFDGLGCSSINVYYEDTETTNSPAPENVFGISWNGNSPVEHNDIHFRVNIRWPSTGAPGSLMAVRKADASNSSDTVNRGHRLINFSLSGVFDFNGNDGNVIADEGGAFASGETVQNLSFSDLEIRNRNASGGNVPLAFFANAITERAIFSNVHGYKTVFCQAPVLALNCSGDTISDSGVGQTQLFISTEFEDSGGTQFTDAAKTFIDCSIAGSEKNTVGPQIQFGSRVDMDSDLVVQGFSAGDRILVTDGVTAPANIGGRAQIYVDAADGDLKVRFGDGVIKTLATDV